MIATAVTVATPNNSNVCSLRDQAFTFVQLLTVTNISRHLQLPCTCMHYFRLLNLSLWCFLYCSGPWPWPFLLSNTYLTLDLLTATNISRSMHFSHTSFLTVEDILQEYCGLAFDTLWAALKHLLLGSGKQAGLTTSTGNYYFSYETTPTTTRT